MQTTLQAPQTLTNEQSTATVVVGQMVTYTAPDGTSYLDL